jgi:fused signal recognition particle receptor
VLAAIALWAAQRTNDKPLSVYFIGIGEQLQDLQAFSADEFAQALIS